MFNKIKILTRKKAAIFAFLILAVVVLVLVLGWGIKKLIGKKEKEMIGSDYSVVYLRSGDIYFGKLSWFPWPTLKNPLYLQRIIDQTGRPQFSIFPFKNIVWEPIDRIYLNPKEIVLWTRLRSTSQLVPLLRDPALIDKLTSQPQPPAISAPDSSAGASSPLVPRDDFRGPTTNPPTN